MTTKFNDWLRANWENQTHDQERKRIVERNVKLISNDKKWKDHVEDFCNTIPKDERGKYTIHFDWTKDFPSSHAGRHFPCAVSFRNVIFGSGCVDFTEATFGNGLVNFSGADFGNGKVKFKKAMFGNGEVCFKNTVFGNGDTNFLETKFGDGDVVFSNAVFGEGCLSFMWTSWGHGDVLFWGAKLSQTEVYMDWGVFQGPLLLDVLFKNDNRSIKKFSARFVQFPKQVSLIGRKFDSVPDFTDSQFVIPPNIANIEIAGPEMKPPGWRIAKGILALKNLFVRPFQIIVEAFQKVADSAASDKYRALKAIAIQNSDHQKELDYFAWELKARRTRFRLFNSLYELFSDYGRSIARPFVSWLVFAGLFALIYQGCGLGGTRALMHSLYTAIPLPVLAFSSGESISLGFELVTAVHTILSLVLLFLLLLGVRNRFKIK